MCMADPAGCCAALTEHRSAIVDKSGREINSNRFIALMAAVVLNEHSAAQRAGNGAAAAQRTELPVVVTDSVTSNGLTAFIKGLGGEHLRCALGRGGEARGGDVPCSQASGMSASGGG